MPFASRASPKTEAMRKNAMKATSGSMSARRSTSVVRALHNVQAESGNAGHAYQGRIRRK